MVQGARVALWRPLGLHHHCIDRSHDDYHKEMDPEKT